MKRGQSGDENAGRLKGHPAFLYHGEWQVHVQELGWIFNIKPIILSLRNEVILSTMTNKGLGGAAVILNKDGHILLVKQSYGHLNWELPGGAAEADESIVGTALREVREETGLLVQAERTTGVYYEPSIDLLHFVFLCHRLDENAEFQPDAEVTECAYWPQNALPRPISDFTIQRIEDALSGRVQTLPAIISSRQWLK